jgi:hypothetical protein
MSQFPSPLPKETIAAIRKAKWAGASLWDIALDWDITKPTVWKYTKDIPVRGRGGRRIQYDHGRVLKLIEQGLSQAVICERLGISRAQVYRICKRAYGVGPSELPAHLAKEWKAAA